MNLSQEERRLTTILGIWGVGCTAKGSIGWFATRDGSHHQLNGFARQTAMWGAIDAAIAGVGWLSSTRRDPFESPAEQEKHRARLRRTLMINSAADVAYIAGGTAVMIAAKSTGSKRVLGMNLTVGDGAAIVVQGAFLLALDAMFAKRLSEPIVTVQA